MFEMNVSGLVGMIALSQSSMYTFNLSSRIQTDITIVL